LLSGVLGSELRPLGLANVHIFAIVVGAWRDEDAVSTFVMRPGGIGMRRPLDINHITRGNRSRLIGGLGPVSAGHIAAPDIIRRREIRRDKDSRICSGTPSGFVETPIIVIRRASPLDVSVS